MNYVRILTYIILSLFFACNKQSYKNVTKKQGPVNSINLKWNKAYTDDNIQKSVIGLRWTLSYIGATLLNEESIKVLPNSLIQISINKLGVSTNTSQKLRLLSDKIKVSEEYKRNNAVDLGRYVTLLLGASEHYYEFVDTPKNLKDLLKQYTLSPQVGYLDNSAISLEHRVLKYSDQNGLNQLFISEETDSITGFIYEFETIELLPNGQLRFGIYDTNGNRINGSDNTHTRAGKPAKCMWCHESGINPLFTSQKNVPNFLTEDVLQQKLLSFRASHEKTRASLINGVDFNKRQEHTFVELLYISFMEPSAERLSLEWNLPLNKVKTMLKELSTHTHDEFKFLGTLYHREDIINLSPFKSVATPKTIRETSNSDEINLLK